MASASPALAAACASALVRECFELNGDVKLAKRCLRGDAQAIRDAAKVRWSASQVRRCQVACARRAAPRPRRRSSVWRRD
jgi:hypothetical protein